MTLPYGNLRSGTSLYGRSGECFIERGVADLHVPYVHAKKRNYFSKMHWTVRGTQGSAKERSSWTPIVTSKTIR